MFFRRIVLAAAWLVAAMFASVPAQEPARVSPSLFADMKWRDIGPHRASRTVAVAGHRRQPHTFYMAAVNGGVWKTTDAGRTWVPIFDDQPTGSIGSIAVAPSDPNIVYVGSGEGLHRPDLSTGDGIYKSTDAGRTWTRLGLNDAQQIPRIDVDPRNANRLFVAALGHPVRAQRGARHLPIARRRQDLSEGALQGREHGRQRRRHRSCRSERRVRHAVGGAAGPVGERGVGGHGRRDLQVDRRRDHVEAAHQRAPACRPGQPRHLSGRPPAAVRGGRVRRTARIEREPRDDGHLPQRRRGPVVDAHHDRHEARPGGSAAATCRCRSPIRSSWTR